MQHYSFKRFQEVLLKVIVAELLFKQKLIRELSERVDRIEGDVEVLVRAHRVEVLAQRLPDLLPHEPYPAHVEVRDLHQPLERELPRVVQICQLLPGDLAEVSDEVDDSVRVQVHRTLDDQVYLVQIDVLHNEL